MAEIVNPAQLLAAYEDAVWSMKDPKDLHLIYCRRRLLLALEPLPAREVTEAPGSDADALVEEMVERLEKDQEVVHQLRFSDKKWLIRAQAYLKRRDET